MFLRGRGAKVQTCEREAMLVDALTLAAVVNDKTCAISAAKWLKALARSPLPPCTLVGVPMY